METINVELVVDYAAHGYRMFKWCDRCGKWVGEVNLAGLIQKGSGHKRPNELRLPCPECRSVVTVRIDPPSRHAR